MAWDVAKHPPWSIATSTSTDAGAHQGQHVACDELRRDRAGDEHGADHHVGVRQDLLDLEAVGHGERDPAVERDLELAHAVDGLVEHPDVRLHAQGDDGRVQPYDTATEDDHLGGRHAGDAAEEDPAAAVRLLERPGAHLRREPAGDLAHRREQRQAAVGGLDRLVGDPGDAGVDQRPRQRLVRGDVEIREEREPLPQAGILALDRLLHLEQELGPRPDLLHVGEPGADGGVRLVGEPGAGSGVLLDEDLVPALDELERPGGRQGDTVLPRLDLFRDPDPHGARDDTAPPRGQKATQPRGVRRRPPLVKGGWGDLDQSLNNWLLFGYWCLGFGAYFLISSSTAGQDPPHLIPASGNASVAARMNPNSIFITVL